MNSLLCTTVLLLLIDMELYSVQPKNGKGLYIKTNGVSLYQNLCEFFTFTQAASCNLQRVVTGKS